MPSGVSKLFVLFPSPERHPHRVANESELIANLVFQVALVREMNVLGVVAKEHKRWRRYIRLRRIVEL